MGWLEHLNDVMEAIPTATSDWTLLTTYIEGDEAAFELLVTKYFRMVYTLAVRQVGDAHLAEEVAQSVFIILARKSAKLSSGVSICGWLVQTTRFVARDALKARQRRLRTEKEFAASQETDLPAKIHGNTLEALLDEALLALPPLEQAGVIAHFVEGKSFKEVGAILAISGDAAQKRVSRSLDKLRMYLVRRGAKVPLATVAGMFTAWSANEPSAQTIQSALQTAKAAATGKLAPGPAVALANRAARLLPFRSALTLGLKLAVPVLLLTGGFGAWREWRIQSREGPLAPDQRIEALAKDWSRIILRFDSVKRSVAAIPPNDPRFQTMLADVNSASQESQRIKTELDVLLTSPRNRDDLADFLTTEVAETLQLDHSEKAKVYSIMRNHLARGATFMEAMKMMAADIPNVAIQVKSILTPDQQRRFDSVYIADASGFLVYLRSAMTGQ